MEEVLIHRAECSEEREMEKMKENQEREVSDSAKVEMTESRRNVIRMGTCVFIWTILICVIIVLIPFNK